MVVNGLNRFINLFEDNVIDRVKIRDVITNWTR